MKFSIPIFFLFVYNIVLFNIFPMSSSNIGILLEIIGFFLYLISAKKLLGGISIEDEKTISITKWWKWAYWEFPDHLGQGIRIIAIVLIIVGLIFQLSYSN